MKRVGKKIRQVFGFRHKASGDNLKIATLSTMAGAFITIIGVILQSQITTHQQAGIEFRNERKNVYIEFIENANTYSNATIAARDCVLSLVNFSEINTVEKSEIIQKKKNPDGTISCPEFNDEVAARNHFQDSINKMYIYGSDEALHAARDIAKILPASVGSATDKYGNPPIDQVISYRRELIDKPFDKFLDEMCVDLRPEDVDVCSER